MKRLGDESTQNASLPGSTGGSGPTTAPALTIVWHPDATRVGEICPLPGLTAGSSVSVTRLQPVFCRAEGGTARALEHSRLSRSTAAVEIATSSQGRIELRPGAGEIPTEVDGVALQRPTTVTTAELDMGVILTVGRRIVLCLHLVRVPVVRGPGMGMVGGDRIERIRELVRRVCDLDVPVLIRGETGSGKEMVARALVDAGSRARAPFVAVNMAAIPATTAASELFGHERGAFTGAATSRSGHFLEASGGTLFLDEIGLMPKDVQSMLLRALETGEVMPLGGSRPKKADVRILSATDADLKAAIGSHAFSEPLFHRLAGFQIVLPPLRERREDIGSLLVHFLRQELATTGEEQRLSQGLDQDGKPWLSASQVATLALGAWPGNVRALRNAVRQIVISSRGEPRARIGPEVEHLMTRPETRGLPEARPGGEQGRTDTGGPARSAWDVGPDALLDALRRNRWSPSATAADLQIPRTTLYSLMDRHPAIRKASTIPADELLRQHRECGGNVDMLAERLLVSRRGLQLRLAQLLSQSPAGPDDPGQR